MMNVLVVPNGLILAMRNWQNVKLKYVKSAGVHGKMTTQLRDDTDERNSDAVSKQLVALQQAVERCHVELKSQREEMRAQRSEIESIRFRAGQPQSRDGGFVGDNLSTGRQPETVRSSSVAAGQNGQTVPGSTRVRSDKKRSGNCYICGEAGHCARS